MAALLRQPARSLTRAATTGELAQLARPAAAAASAPVASPQIHGLPSLLHQPHSRGNASHARPVTQDSTSKHGPTAIVFMNMGGPSTTDEVGGFLSRLFADGDLIPLGPLQNYLGPLISRRRTPKIQKQYAAIGGGSPIRRWSEHQAAETCRLLDELSPQTAPHRPYVAFRYADPLTGEMYARLLEDGFGRGGRHEGGRAVAFSQYPQYSCSTTGSSLNDLWRWRQRLEGKRAGGDTTDSSSPSSAFAPPEAAGERDGSVRWSVIDRWPTHPGLVDAVCENVNAALDAYPRERRDGVVLLFSAHSLPMSVVNRGDPYPAEVAATVHAVQQRLGQRNAHRLVWQSQVGPSAWLGAQTADAVQNYVKKGQADLLLVPIAFTSDHIETLYELDVEVVGEAEELCHKLGVECGVRRAESLNGNKTFIAALADLAARHLASGRACSPLMSLRCPACKSERCAEQKKFFAAMQQRLPELPLANA